MRATPPRTKLAAIAVILVAAARAEAHQSSVVYLELDVAGRTVGGTVQIADIDVAPALGLGERGVDQRAVKEHAAQLGAYLADHLHVTNAGFPCAPTPGAVETVDKSDGFFAVAHLAWQCKRTVADLVVRYDLFFDVDPRHQGFARVVVPGEPPREHVFRAQARELQLSRTVTLLDHVRDYLYLGVEHIFTGYDHLAFLFGLLVVAGFATLGSGLRYILGVVTAFTVAHSLTLIASGLDLLRLPSRVVEPAIALSIFYVAVENLVVQRPRFRWLLTFGFGLVHGFGFASVLREIGLPPRGLVLSLLSFNVGVELGQLAVVALVSPALWMFARGRLRARDLALLALLATGAFALFRRFDLPAPQLLVVLGGAPLALAVAVPRVGYDTAVRRAGSVVLAALSAFWFLERVLEKSWLSGQLG